MAGIASQSVSIDGISQSIGKCAVVCGWLIHLLFAYYTQPVVEGMA